MRYHVAPRVDDDSGHPAVVQELVDAGLERAGGLVNDLSPDHDHRVVRGYPPDVRDRLLEEMGRATPILLSPDRVVAVEVSDMLGAPAVRMRTLLADGSLVETGRRWERVLPWPGRAAAFHRFARVDREMARSVAPGRSLVISDRSPAGQLEDHRGHVARVSAARGSAPTRWPDLESVAAGWNAAFAHEQAVARRADLLFALAVLALALGILFLPTHALDGSWQPVVAVALFACFWWAYPGLVLLLWRRITWRPAFRSTRATDVP